MCWARAEACWAFARTYRARIRRIQCFFWFTGCMLRRTSCVLGIYSGVLGVYSSSAKPCPSELFFSLDVGSCRRQTCPACQKGCTVGSALAPRDSWRRRWWRWFPSRLGVRVASGYSRLSLPAAPPQPFVKHPDRVTARRPLLLSSSMGCCMCISTKHGVGLFSKRDSKIPTASLRNACARPTFYHQWVLSASTKSLTRDVEMEG